MRHSNLLRTRGSYESLNGPNGELNDVWPIRPTRGVNRGYQFGILRTDGTLAKYTSVCAPMMYRGDRLPAELYGNVFVVDPTVNLVSRIVLGDSGSGLTADKAYREVQGEFLASTDERFRPVNLSLAPDGTLYVVDMYRGIIQHKGYMTEYLRDYVQTHKLEQPNSFGRIYRVMHESTKRDTTPLPGHVAKRRRGPATDNAQLVSLLSHPNGWRRDTAQQLLVERGDKSVVPALRKLASSSTDPRARLKALWVLDGLDAIEPGDVTPALSHANRDVRVSALRLSERWLRMPNHPMAGAVMKRRRRLRLGGAASARCDARRASGRIKGGSAGESSRALRRRSDCRRCGVERRTRQRARRSRATASERRRDATAIGCHHDACGDDRACG